MPNEYPKDFSWAGRSSSVKVIYPDGRSSIQEGTIFESIPEKNLNRYQLFKDENELKTRNAPCGKNKGKGGS